MKIVVSACLMGESCKYNGLDNYHRELVEACERTGTEVLLVCPEVFGGLPTPRKPSEIVNGEVCTCEGVSVDLEFRLGAQRALDIVVNTGYVSNLTNQNDYYYNSSVAHAFYNATCSIPREGTYLHGEVVSLGVLVLFAYTGDTENLKRYADFNKQMGLPVTLEQVGLSETDIPALCEHAHATNEWKQGNPEPFTDEKFAAAIKAANAYGHTL